MHAQLFSIELAITDERLLDTMDHFLAPNCGQYQLNSSEVIEIHGGETAQALHTDDMIWPVNAWVPDRLLQFNVMVAGTDFTVANGATNVVPGSHKWTDRNGDQILAKSHMRPCQPAAQSLPPDIYSTAAERTRTASYGERSSPLMCSAGFALRKTISFIRLWIKLRHYRTE